LCLQVSSKMVKIISERVILLGNYFQKLDPDLLWMIYYMSGWIQPGVPKCVAPIASTPLKMKFLCLGVIVARRERFA